MSNKGDWHSQDAFWELIEPALYSEQRLSHTAEEVDQIVRLLQMEQPLSILDLCCGIGRHSLEFYRRGYQVAGVDRTTRYIDRARQAAADSNLNVEFIVGDMREYCLPKGFDIVVNLFGSFGYFDDPADDRHVVENIYASLRPGGRFLIETMGKEILARHFQERDWSEEGDLLLLSEKRIGKDWARIYTRWIAIRDNQRIEHTVSVRSYSAVELSSLLRECGFSEVEVYGSLEGIRYDHSARRLVVVGHKPE